MGSLTWYRSGVVAIIATLAMAAVACGGDPKSSPKADGSSAAPSSSPSPSPSPTGVPADVVAAFQSADQAYASRFAAAEAQISAGRSANNHQLAVTGGRAARDTLFSLDADLRKITFPTDVSDEANAVMAAIAEAISAFDAQNVTADRTAYVAVDERLGAAMNSFIAGMRSLRTALGLPPERPAVASPTPSASAKFVSPQQPLSRPYVKGSTITDATAWVTDLLAVGKANVDAAHTYAATRSYSFGIVEAWVGAFPLLTETGVVGSGVEAPQSGVSGFTVMAIDSKNPPSASNPEALPFAVRDASGRCAAGVLYGAELPTQAKTLTLAAGAECTGNSAREAAVKAGFR